jgi:hypothetical protein
LRVGLLAPSGGWTIKREIEDKLIAPMEANRPELPALH